MGHKKQYLNSNGVKKPAPTQAMKEKIFDTRKGLKKFLKRKFG